MEQKNWTQVRKLVGWDRDESAPAQQALNALYADLRSFQNLFQPSMKRRRKVRKGARLIRRSDPPQTPFARGRACPETDPVKVAARQRSRATTDPFALAQRIEHHLDRVATWRSRDPQPVPRARSPWRGWTFRSKNRRTHTQPPRERTGETAEHRGHLRPR
ncbi:MAG: hypothetical protein ACREJU_06755 [Nitrospiraceae bacterium]